MKTPIQEFMTYLVDNFKESAKSEKRTDKLFEKLLEKEKDALKMAFVAGMFARDIQAAAPFDFDFETVFEKYYYKTFPTE